MTAKLACSGAPFKLACVVSASDRGVGLGLWPGPGRPQRDSPHKGHCGTTPPRRDASCQLVLRDTCFAAAVLAAMPHTHMHVHVQNNAFVCWPRCIRVQGWQPWQRARGFARRYLCSAAQRATHTFSPDRTTRSQEQCACRLLVPTAQKREVGRAVSGCLGFSCTGDAVGHPQGPQCANLIDFGSTNVVCLGRNHP